MEEAKEHRDLEDQGCSGHHDHRGDQDHPLVPGAHLSTVDSCGEAESLAPPRPGMESGAPGEAGGGA